VVYKTITRVGQNENKKSAKKSVAIHTLTLLKVKSLSHLSRFNIIWSAIIDHKVAHFPLK